MKKYFYFGKAANGAYMPIFECVGDDAAPTPEQTNSIYQEIVRQQGLGVPRPTHYAAMELHEIELTDEVGAAPLLLHGDAPLNGAGGTIH